MSIRPRITGSSRVRAAFDRLARQIFVRVALAIGVMTATLVYLMFVLHAASTKGSDVLLLATLATALTAAACGALAPLVRKNWLLREEIDRLEACVESLSDRQWELREAEERTKSLIEAQGDVIVRRDGEGRITYANDAFCALAGRPRDALIGSTFVLSVLEDRQAALLPDGTRARDQKIDTTSGPRWISWHEVSVRSYGSDRTETQSVGRDVTDRALTEQALAEARDQADAANRAKSRFLAMVSHEIRTPLNGILGMAGMLRETTLTPEQTTYVKAIQSSGDTLLSLIEEILDFSKIEAGKLDLDRRPFDIEPLVEDVVELLSPRAHVKSIEIASFIDEQVPRRVVGDAARVRQILLNLAGNAVKFTEKGGVSITVEPGSLPAEIAFAVCDSGIGIAPEAQTRIFEEFEQADGGPTRKFGGTGLGLAISKRLADRMGGRIAMTSAPGVGSTFSFTVALPRTEDAKPASAPNLAGTRVLIVAPTQIEAHLLARRLTAWGARACVVAEPSGALSALAEEGWDALIVDHALGDAAELVRACPATTRLRLVLLTPQTRNELAALKEAGFTGYLVKPVRAASLAARFGAEPDACEPPEAAHEAGGEAGTGSLSILVAEDNEINALLARALLTRLGHQPTIAMTGADAVESFLAAGAAGRPYDLVLMDLHMPGIDGLAATSRIRAIEAETGAPRTRIIALTANVTSEDREACLAAGMDGFLVKPLDRDRLIETLTAKSASLAA